MKKALVFVVFFLPFSVSAETLSLSSGIKAVLREENLIRIKAYDEAISVLDSKVARSALLPHVDFSLGKVFLEHQMTAKNVVPSPYGAATVLHVPTSEKEFHTYSMSIKQLIFDFFGSHSLFRSSEVASEIKRMDLERTKNYVAFEFVKAYFNLLEADKMVELAQKDVERFESHLRDAQNLFQEGLITKNDLLQAEVMLSDASQRLINARNSRNMIASTINKMLGRPLTEELHVEQVQRELPVLADLDSYFEEAERRRIELRMVDALKRQLDLLKKAKMSEFLPKLFAECKYSYTKNEYQLYEGMWSLLVGMNLNLFEGGRKQAELKKIEMERMKANVEENRVREDVRLEVERYYLDALNAKERMKVAEGALRQAEENLRIVRTKYKEGAGTATEVVDAITLFHLAETNYFRAFYDLLRSEAGLSYATGKSLEEVYGR